MDYIVDRVKMVLKTLSQYCSSDPEIAATILRQSPQYHLHTFYNIISLLLVTDHFVDTDGICYWQCPRERVCIVQYVQPNCSRNAKLYYIGRWYDHMEPELYHCSFWCNLYLEFVLFCCTSRVWNGGELCVWVWPKRPHVWDCTLAKLSISRKPSNSKRTYDWRIV
jgi:hypothetical protein